MICAHTLLTQFIQPSDALFVGGVALAVYTVFELPLEHHCVCELVYQPKIFIFNALLAFGGPCPFYRYGFWKMLYRRTSTGHI